MILNQMRLEWLKLWRLPLLRAVAILLILAIVLYFAASYLAFREVREAAREAVRQAPAGARSQVAMGREAAARLLQSNLTLPSAYGAIFSLSFFPGFVLASLIVASTIGNEFAWSTARQTVALGQSRAAYVTAKLLVTAGFLALFVVATWLAGSAAAAVTSRSVSRLSLDFVDWSFARDTAVMGLRSLLALGMYGAFSALFAFGLRAMAAGVAGPLVMYFLENVLSLVLIQARGWLAAARLYLPTNVANTLVTENNPFLGGLMGMGPPAAASLMGGQTLSLAGATEAALIYILVSAALCYALFLRRDLPV